MIVYNTSQSPISVFILPGLLSEAVYWPMLSVTLGLDLFAGVFAAGANIVTVAVYRKLGYADSTNISLTALAISDLGGAITTIACVLAILLPTISNAPFTFDIFYPYTAAPHVHFLRCSALISTYLSVERFICISFPLKIKSILTPGGTFIALVMSYIAAFIFWPLHNIRWPVGWRFCPKRNRSLLRVLPATDTMILSLYAVDQLYSSVVLPVLTFSMVLATTLLLTLRLQSINAWRYETKSVPSAALALRKEKEARAVKMVIAIATVLIIFTIPYSVHVIFVMVVPGFSLTGRYVYLYTVTGMAFLIVDCLNGSANVIIYYNMSTKYRQVMLNMFRGKA